eukprot:UN01874
MPYNRTGVSCSYNYFPDTQRSRLVGPSRYLEHASKFHEKFCREP